MTIVGCFEVELIDQEKGKWQCKNTLTGFTHATYGEEAQVFEQLRRQSKIYVQKHADNSLRIRGKAWRGQISAETRKAASAKAKT